MLIWQKEQIKRDYKGTTIDYYKSDFYRYLTNVSGSDDALHKFMCTIGYMICCYKNPSLAKVVVLTDMAIALSRNDANGGTGKGIFIKALAEIRSVYTIDKYNPESTHTFQKYKLHHRIIAFTDANPGFDFRSIFNAATESLEVRRMYEGAFDVSYDKSPKFIIATNDVIVGITDSHKRRLYTLEFTPYYSKDFSPFNEFGRNMFGDEWGKEQYAHFDYIISICVNYFKTYGLPAESPVNALIRQLLACTNVDFVDYILEDLDGTRVNMPLEGEVYLHDLYNKFVTAYAPDKLDMPTFAKWLNNYFKIYDIKFEKKRKVVEGQKRQTYVIYK